MEFSHNFDPRAKYQMVGPLLVNDDVLGVTDGRYITATIGRHIIVRAGIEQRSSFKHPIAGAVVGTLFVYLSICAIPGNPLGGDGVLPVRLGAAAIFLAAMGIYLLASVIRRKDVPWLVVETIHGQRAFPLYLPVTQEVIQVLATLGRPAGQMSGREAHQSPDR